MTTLKRNYSLFLVIVALNGCATLPTGPSVRVLPAPGKSFEQFQTDDVVCRDWAGQRIGMTSQESINKSTATGAATGTIIGAGLGAAIGAASGHPGAGAAVGAASGLLVGTAAGSNSGEVYGWEAQRRYDIAYEQCMYAKGNQVPGVVTHRARRSLPPPPSRVYPVPPDYVPQR